MPRLVWSLCVILGRKCQSSVLFPESKVAGRHFISVRFQSPLSLITLRQSLSSVIAPVTIPGRRRPLVTIPADVASTIPIYRRLSVTIPTNACHSPFLVAPGFPFTILLRRRPFVSIPTRRQLHSHSPPSFSIHSHLSPVPQLPFPLASRPSVSIPTCPPSSSHHSHSPLITPPPNPSLSPHSRPPLAKGFHSTPGCVGHL